VSSLNQKEKPKSFIIDKKKSSRLSQNTRAKSRTATESTVNLSKQSGNKNGGVKKRGKLIEITRVKVA
jgi:hypothetical protein